MLTLGPVRVDPPLVLSDGGHYGPRVPADAAAHRRRGACDDGVHLLRGDHPRQRPAAAQAALLRRGAAAVHPDLRLGRGTRMAAAADIVEGLARRLRHQHGMPGEQGPQGLRGSGADGGPAARAGDRSLGQEAAVDSADGEVSPGIGRPADELPRPRQDVRGRGRGAVAMHARTARQMYTGRRRTGSASRSCKTISRSRSSATATWPRRTTRSRSLRRRAATPS